MLIADIEVVSDNSNMNLSFLDSSPFLFVGYQKNKIRYDLLCKTSITVDEKQFLLGEHNSVSMTTELTADSTACRIIQSLFDELSSKTKEEILYQLEKQLIKGK